VLIECAQMVLDAGRLVRPRESSRHFQMLTQCCQVEFGRPSMLLEKEGGYLRALVDESADKDELLVLANKTEAMEES
jgi:hypothetical protein